MSEREQKKKRAYSFSKGDPTLHCTFSQWFIPPSHRVTGGRAIKNRNILFWKRISFSWSFSTALFHPVTPSSFGCNPLFHSGIYHVTCIWPVSKSPSYSLLTLYLACSIIRLLSANLSLSFSPSHQVTLDSGIWQPRCRCSPVRACLKQDFKTNSEELKSHNCGTLQHWKVYADTRGSHLTGLF